MVDFAAPLASDWLAVNQFTVVENKHERRPDIVLFVNGLPLGVIELKNPADENATIRSAFQQLQTYKGEFPSLFVFNAALLVSDGLEARIGTLTASWEWFKPWRTITGETLAGSILPQLQVLVDGVCASSRLMVIVGDFMVFRDDGSGAPGLGGLAGSLVDGHDTDIMTFQSGTCCRRVRTPPRGWWWVVGGLLDTTRACREVRVRQRHDRPSRGIPGEPWRE